MMLIAALVILGSTHAAMPTNPAANDFTFRFNRAVVEPDSKTNQLVSGLSAQFAFAMLANGARGASQELLAKVLGGSSVDALNHASTEALASLTSSKGAEFTAANSIWSLVDANPTPEFRKTLFDAYGAEFQHLDGAGPAELNLINQWVRDHTRNRIPKILDRLDPSNRLLVVNALTFDGKWSDPFSADLTHDQVFRAADGTTPRVPMMMKTDAIIPYAKGADGSRAIRLDYEGGEFSAVLLLPDEHASPTETFRSMTSSKFETLLGSLHEAKTRVVIPKIKYSANYTLAGDSSSTEQLGIRSLFSEMDLSGVSPAMAHGLALSQVVQYTFLEWDETGTKAAAATGAMVSLTAIAVDPPQFIADRPFLFFIIHQPTKQVIFSGLIQNPAV